jgi:hypothetical protein
MKHVDGRQKSNGPNIHFNISREQSNQQGKLNQMK